MVSNILEIISEFKSFSKPEDRYSSFDYCYNYFQKVSGSKLTKDIEKSCLTLGFYLASWGMLRGSSFLLQKSARHFVPTIEYLSKLEKSVWLIDVDNYKENMSIILDIYNDLKKRIIIGNKADLTLITKIMLGVFGFIPAFDQYFCDAFKLLFKDEKCGFSVVNLNSLTCIKSFYDRHRNEIDNIAMNTFTTDFETGEKTSIKYTKAKIIDMYGFTVGMKRANAQY